MSIGALIVAGMLIPFPSGSWFLVALLNMAHAPAFALLSIFVMRLLQSRWGWWPAALGTIAIIALAGAGTEWVQTFSGRVASWTDFRADLAGGAIGVMISVPLTFAWARNWGGWAIVVCLSCLLIGAVSRYSLAILIDLTLYDQSSPLLASFEYSWETTRWFSNDADCAPTSAFHTHGKRGLRVKFSPEPQFASIHLSRMRRDWTGFKSLKFDIHLPGDQPQRLHVKVHDEFHNDLYVDRFNTQLLLRPGAHGYEIPLDQIRRGPVARELVMTHITTLEFFTADRTTPLEIALDHIRLE